MPNELTCDCGASSLHNVNAMIAGLLSEGGDMVRS